jgi:hypothetical protein
MKPTSLFALLSVASLSGCILPAPLGTHYDPGSFTPKPNDQCAPYYLDQPSALSVVNASAGQPYGVGQRIASIGDSRSITTSDAEALGIPMGAGNVIEGIACYATLHYQAGSTETGVLTSIRPDPSQPYRLTWISQQNLDEARRAQGELDRKAQEHLREEQQQSIAYSGYLQACTLEWKVAIEAKSLLASGESQDAVEDDLVNRHAYGPNGQVYRSSEDVAAMIHQVVAAVATPADMRSQNHIPDYTSQLFLADCPAKARQATEAAENGGGR